MSSNLLVCDGGVIKKNPSSIGGTWAYRHVLVYDDGRESIIDEQSGWIDPGAAETETVSNNLTEMLAALYGLMSLPSSWVGTVYSDSQVTLGRLFDGWKWNNIPNWMHKIYQEQRLYLVNWSRIEYVLLDGHPTKRN